jgi:hypothetical protein
MTPSTTSTRPRATRTGRDVTTPRGFKDRNDDSLFTLLGDVPELVRNLVVAEINSAKAWLGRTAKDAGKGGIWAIIALFLLFWLIPVILAFTIIGISSWLPAWASALIVLGILLVAIAVTGLLSVLKFRKLASRENPAQSVAKDVKEIRDEF